MTPPMAPNPFPQPKMARIKSQQISDLAKLLIRIKIYRNGRSITQEDIAKTLGVSLRTYQRIEQGTAPLEMGLLYKLCGIFEVSYENLAAPTVTQSMLPNVNFIKTFKDQPKPYPFDETPIVKVFKELKNDIDDKKFRVKDLHKNESFRDHERAFYFSDPNFTWVNKTLAQSLGNRKVTKVSVMKNMSDFEFIVRIWELCYDKSEPWYYATTEHNENGVISEVTTLNYFTLNTGLPLVFGTVIGAKVKNP